MTKSIEVEQEVCVYTIGHSTRSADEFNEILNAHKIKNLVDVRSFPGSRRYPHFNQANLAASLHEVDISYHHFASLGGRRRPLPNSKNAAWTNPSFRAYADYMESDSFQDGVSGLLEIARIDLTAIMCAEAVWWRCHRGLISDYLMASGTKVIHIVDANRSEVHPYTSAARIIDGTLSYEGLLANNKKESMKRKVRDLK